MRMLKTVACMGLLWAAGCTDDEPEETSCKKDYDCSFDQVCGSDEVCTKAGDGSERNFSDVTMSFDTGSEVYLMAVYAVPAGEEARSATALYGFTSGGSSALRIGRPSGYDGMRSMFPTLPANSSFEQRRRAQINRYVDDIRSGKRSSVQSSTRGVANGVCATGTCTLTFVEGATVDMTSLTTIDGIHVLVDDAAPSGHTAEMEAAVQAFADVMTEQQAILGTSIADWDRDGSSTLTVAFTNQTVSGVPIDTVGLFDFHDFLAASEANATGNEADILWVRVPGTNVPGSGAITPELLAGTMAHEFTHLVSYARRVYTRGSNPLREVLWLDEGLAHLMEDVSGFGGSNIGYAAAALSSFTNSVFGSGTDSVEQRGMAYSLLRHMLDQHAGDVSDAFGANSSAGTFYDDLLSESKAGFEHSAFNETAVWEWIVATYASGNADVSESAAHAFDYLPTGTHGTTGNIVGLDPYKDDYVDARGGTVSLVGPEELVEILDPASSTDLADQSVEQSGVQLYLVSGGTGSVTLVGKGTSGIPLYARAVRVQ